MEYKYHKIKKNYAITLIISINIDIAVQGALISKYQGMKRQD